MKKRSVLVYGMQLFLLLTISMQFAFGQTQEKLITGSVKDSSGEPIPGANVVEKETSEGTITNGEGEFSLEVEDPQEGVLRISFIGFETEEIPIEDNTNFEITLKQEDLDLDEVVVVGYGSTKKSDLTGSVGSVQLDELNERPANSVEKLLQGRSAGLQVINSSQDPGAGSEVRIRGGSSLEGSNAPLVVVDGFPLGDAGDLKQINPQNIESIEVMKDASASAIYGSKGANGVIMVTTTRSEEGTMQVRVDQQTTVSQFDSELLRWEDPLLMAMLANEEQRNAGLQIPYRGETNSQGVYHPSLYEIASGEWPHNTKWDEIVFRDAPVNNNTTVSLNGATEKTSFNLNLNYLNEQGVYIEDDYQKGIVDLSVDHEFSDFFNVSTSNRFSRNLRDRNQGLAYWRNPLWPVYDEDGTYFKTSERDFSHPIALTDHVLNKTNGLDYMGSYQFNFHLHDNLTLKSQVNYKHGSTKTDLFNPEDHTEEGYFRNGAAHIENWQDERFSTETFATYENQFGMHDISIMAGSSYESYSVDQSQLRAFDFVNEALQNENMSAGDPESNEVWNDHTERRMLSYYGRLKYKLMDKYLFTGTFRTDGSSVFGENNKWANFPSFAVSWNAHHEPFIEDLGLFDQLKFRASYGTSGNQAIAPYQTLAQYGVENYYDGGAWRTAIGPGYIGGYYGADDRYAEWRGIPNKSLKWETTAQNNYGVDMAFFDHRLGITFDFYDKETDDLLYQRYLAPSSSYDRMWVNGGKIRNEGFELTVDGDIIRQRGDWNLSATFIYSQNRNEVLSLGDTETAGNQIDPMTGMEYRFRGYEFTQFRQSANVLAVGEPFNVFYGYKTDGIVQSLDEGLAAGMEGYLAEPGEFKYVDLNEDGEITTADRTIIGDPNPDFTASLSVDLGYKNFDFSVFLNGVYGNDIVYQDKLTQPDVRPFRWTPDNPTNEYPRLYSGRQLRFSDWFVEDGSFLRVQEMTLGYNFNTESMAFLSNLRVYVNASNLYTFTDFSGYDPEVGLDGIYWGGHPRQTQYTFGLNVSF